MKIIISGKQLEMTEPIKEYVESKISKITKYLENINETHVTLTVEPTKSEGKIYKAIATVYAPNKTLRQEESDPDLYAAIDNLSSGLERQVRKYKEKMKDRTE
ncbi:ribosome hibernation-promoting factor, HPF/YfiA family [Streptobacillus felis]|uniref:Ribosome-associated translation inhibitor RaiA n=1 Tax=Streptobacillus felis TaxID=1384509 RepID=A0A7Z0PDE5_9FUSO|nr:ribosome-associated translation inhibitor RaiA [Streptobacillus felis]NYV27208.1 ribosome-associated translation inhibitor RaiA [Streptobacillus felis]